jgi:DNA-binding NarL/FixJ family response regulator
MKTSKGNVSKASAKKKIMVVDDHPVFRNGLIELVNRQNDFICCADTSDSDSTKEAALKHQPDLVLLDLRLGQEDGLELIKWLRSQLPALHILVVSSGDELIYAERALRAGARGYIMKDEASEEVVTAIRAVLAGELYVSRKIAVLILHKFLNNRPDVSGPGGIERLTDRELQVFQMLGAGLSTRQIAEELKLSFKTIQTHRENIKQKLALRDAPELIHRATTWLQGQPLPRGPQSSQAREND